MKRDSGNEAVEGSVNKKRQYVGYEPGSGDGDGDGGKSGEIDASVKKRRVEHGFDGEGAGLSWMAERQPEEKEGRQLGGQDRLPSVDMDSAVGSQDLMTEISDEGNGAMGATEKSTGGDWLMMEDENGDGKRGIREDENGDGKRGILEAASGAKKIRVHLPDGYHSSKYGVDDAGRNMAMLNSMERGRECAVISKELKAGDENDGFHSMALVPYAPLPIHALVQQHIATEADEARSEQQSNGSMEME